MLPTTTPPPTTNLGTPLPAPISGVLTAASNGELDLSQPSTFQHLAAALGIRPTDVLFLQLEFGRIVGELLKANHIEVDLRAVTKAVFALAVQLEKTGDLDNIDVRRVAREFAAAAGISGVKALGIGSLLMQNLAGLPFSVGDGAARLVTALDASVPIKPPETDGELSNAAVAEIRVAYLRVLDDKDCKSKIAELDKGFAGRGWPLKKGTLRSTRAWLPLYARQYLEAHCDVKKEKPNRTAERGLICLAREVICAKKSVPDLASQVTELATSSNLPADKLTQALDAYLKIFKPSPA